VIKKIKPILPTLREKKRYLMFEILSKSKIKDFSRVSSAIWASSLSFLGEWGAAKAGILMLPDKYNAKTQRGIIKVNHKYVNELKASLVLIKRIEDDDVIIRSVTVSGILKKAAKHVAG
jgi:ribonuclease P/MRP protein subunit POP5